jgi:DNA-binding IclR family transcriptional regulator
VLTALATQLATKKFLEKLMETVDATVALSTISGNSREILARIQNQPILTKLKPINAKEPLLHLQVPFLFQKE